MSNSNKSFHLVTSFFDLSARDGDKNRTIDRYLKYGPLLLNNVPSITIFTEEQFIPLIIQHRSNTKITKAKWNEYDRQTILLNNGDIETNIIYLPLEELPLYRKFYSSIENIDHHYSPRYSILTVSKFTMLLEAMKITNYTHYGFVDFSLYHLQEESIDFLPHSDEAFKVENIPDKIKILRVQPFNKEMIENDFFDETVGYMGGEYFTGHQNHMKKLCQKCLDYYNDTMKTTPRLLCDEKLLSRYAVEEPMDIDFYYGYYHAILSNYHQHRYQLEYLTKQIDKVRLQNTNTYAIIIDMVEKCVDAMIANNFDLDFGLFFRFLDNTYIIAYYQGRKDICNKIGQYFKRMLCYPQFHQIYYQNKARIDTNFSFVGIKFETNSKITWSLSLNDNFSVRWLTHSGDFINDCAYREGRFSPTLYDTYHRYINNESIVIDAGANIGTYTIEASKIAKKVYSFEPLPKVYNQLCANILLNDCGNVESYNVALGDKNTIIGIYASSATNIGATRMVGTDTVLETTNIVGNTKCRTLDKYNIAPTFIKMDVEGYEYKILLGSRNTIEKYKPTIGFEMHNFFRVRKELLEYLHSYGYLVVKVDNDDYLAIQPNVVQRTEYLLPRIMV